MNFFSTKPKVITTADITSDVMVFWSTKYPAAIFEFSENGKVGYFRKLTVKELERELKLLNKEVHPGSDQQKEATEFSFKLIELSMLGGDAEILKTEPFKTSVLNQVGDYVLKTINDTFPELGVK